VVTDPTPALNPYAPTLAVEDHHDPAESSPLVGAVGRPQTLRRIAFRWFLICGLSAIPSFVFGLSLTGGRVWGMLTGIVIFALLYTWLDYRTASRPFRQQRLWRRTLKITYGTRIGMSIVFPLGMFPDMYCGLLAVGLTQLVLGSDLSSWDATGGMTFGIALLTTLVQGCLLNIVLGCYALLVFLAQVVVGRLRG
jgi:hypothetical protein